jgi:hypothetical protein
MHPECKATCRQSTVIVCEGKVPLYLPPSAPSISVCRVPSLTLRVPEQVDVDQSCTRLYAMQHARK